MSRPGPGAFAPIHVGVSPSGVEWVAHRPDAVDHLRRRLAEIWARHEATTAAPTAPVAPAVVEETESALERAQARYRSARRRVFRLRGEHARARNAGRPGAPQSIWAHPGYAAASDACTAARRDLRRLERKLGAPRYDVPGGR